MLLEIDLLEENKNHFPQNYQRWSYKCNKIFLISKAMSEFTKMVFMG